MLVSVGRSYYKFPDGMRSVSLGQISSEPLLSLIYSLADVFVMPSVQEAFGMTGIEAMACGAPVVAFDTGGPRDFVKDGVTGRLVPVGDAEALAQAIAEALSWHYRSSLQARCREHVLSAYTLAAQATAYRSLYQRVLAQGM